ncbi:MAG: UDP-N-acetylmuramoyl-L-alanyl-D-glutamate--2,6-diaminopimelate ligase [Acutalibacteraceae bacterium]|nr:UDP-N-acetylmuramoyl-L-alanyl-D-glutamate--2,6-diaminopimelate ligase [Acutalibacteraceae bacterium]
MLLKELLPKNYGSLGNVEITGVTCNSKEVKEGYAFVCICGTNVDGHTFAEAAVQSGAAVIVAERDLGLDNQIIVDDTHSVFANMCAVWFGNPADKMHLIGVTGTNGKTSVTYMLKKILEKAGHKVGLIGTIQNMIGDRELESKNTTPGAYELNSLFSQMYSEGCSYVIMEVSSHALHQRRVCDLCFDVAIFTNLTQDHLDYHITMENYLEAKKMLFKMCKTAVINNDTPYSDDIIKDLDCKVVTYSTGNDATYSAKGVKYRPSSVDYELLCSNDNALNHVRVNTGGSFTVYNSMCAAIAAIESGVDAITATQALAELQGVKGRAEAVPTGRDFTVIIDYAHTPDGLKNILSTFRDCEKNRLIALFGCGGDRDKTKRPIMGSIAVRNSDYVIVTSDNPRSEDPSEIIKDILVGTEGSNVPIKVIENRIEAIKFAISIAQKDDIIVLAGKGHETYQILKDGTIHLDEREVIKEALGKGK